MTDNQHSKTDKSPPPVFSSEPEPELEERLRQNPKDADAKADLGSDESMDASDPSSATQPDAGEGPVPSSGFPEDEKDDGRG